MAQSVTHSDGFSLIEVIISLFIILIALIDLLGALNLTMNIETQNEVRNALLKIIDQKRNEIEANMTISSSPTLCDNYAGLTSISITNSTISKYISSYNIWTSKQEQNSNTICIAYFSWAYKGKSEHVTRIIVVRKK